MRRRGLVDLKSAAPVGDLPNAAARNVQTMVKTALTVLLTVSLLGIAACGDDTGDESETTAAPDVEPTATTAAGSDEAQPAEADLERFLLRDGEEPGFKRIAAPRTDTGVEAFVQGGDVPDDEAQRLDRAGFIAFTFQPVVVDGGNAGVTNVHLFETARGARDWMAWETSDEGIQRQIPDTKIHRFAVAASRGRAAGPGPTSTAIG